MTTKTDSITRHIRFAFLAMAGIALSVNLVANTKSGVAFWDDGPVEWIGVCVLMLVVERMYGLRGQGEPWSFELSFKDKAD